METTRGTLCALVEGTWHNVALIDFNKIRPIHVAGMTSDSGQHRCQFQSFRQIASRDTHAGGNSGWCR